MSFEVNDWMNHVFRHLYEHISQIFTDKVGREREKNQREYVYMSM